MAARIEGEDGVPLADPHRLGGRELPWPGSPPRPCMKITAGQPPGGGAASGRVSVAASGVPSVDVIVTSWRVKAPAGAEREERRDGREHGEQCPSREPRHGGQGSPRS